MTKILLFSGIIIISVLILGFLICKIINKCKLLNDILMDYDTQKILKYSQGRVYLFISIVTYFITLGVLYVKALKPMIGIDANSIQSVIDGEQWAIALFAGYVFGSKGLEVLKFIMSKTKNPISPSPSTEEKIN